MNAPAPFDFPVKTYVTCMTIQSSHSLSRHTLKSHPQNIFRYNGRIMDLAYSELNLHRNPFGELSVAERIECAVVNCSRFLEHLKKQRSAIQFIGDEGRGKSTHLLSLSKTIPDAKYYYLPENGKRPRVRTKGLLIIDETQRLGRWTRKRIFNSNCSLVLGTHQDFANELKTAHRETMFVNLNRPLPPKLLLKMLTKRVAICRRTKENVPRFSLRTVRHLIDLYGNNIRAIERHLYDIFESLGGPDEI